MKMITFKRNGYRWLCEIVGSEMHCYLGGIIRFKYEAINGGMKEFEKHLPEYWL